MAINSELDNDFPIFCDFELKIINFFVISWEINRIMAIGEKDFITKKWRVTYMYFRTGIFQRPIAKDCSCFDKFILSIVVYVLEGSMRQYEQKYSKW